MVSVAQPDAFDGSIVGNPLPSIGFVTTPHPDCQWTWTTLLGELLNLAEQQYGRRDTSWTILGVEFGGDIPMVWYPGPYPNAVAIRLSAEMAHRPRSAFSELAHEVIHLLAPSGGANANNFEEGLATAFSDQQCGKKGVPLAQHHPSYKAAADAVRRVVAVAPDGVKSARGTMPSFGEWTPAGIAPFFPQASQADLDFLCAPFARS
jgi:hypothetical protein